MTFAQLAKDSKAKHYTIKSIEYFLTAMFNKFKPQFRELLAVKGKDGDKIDFMNLKRFYFDYLNILKQGIDKYEDLTDHKETVLFEVNEFITRRLNRQIFQLCEPSIVDTEIQRKL